MFRSSRCANARRLLFALASTAAFGCGALPAAAQTPPASLNGRVVDAQTGLPLAGATIAIVDRDVTTVSDGNGRFALASVVAGEIVLRISHQGYQTSDTDRIALLPGRSASVEVSEQAVKTGSTVTTIGRTAVRSANTLQKASTIYQTLDTGTLIETGTARAGDALRRLPGVNNGITGDTAALSDDLELSIRGIGTLETLTTIDGHPIAYGVPGGFNFQISPIFGLNDISVTYGSGANAFGTSAIGGTVDMRTLEPTLDQRISLTQGYGSFDRAQTIGRVTGTADKLGYALAFGVNSLDGPIKDSYPFQPTAAFDQSANTATANQAVRDLGIYKDDSTAVGRSGLVKLRYAASDTTRLTFTTLASSYWADKTGNGDGDYLAAGPALAIGNGLLASYKPFTVPPKGAPANYPAAVPACAAGTFLATNANGFPNGFGPSGLPDGGTACQTPAQYAAFNTGFDGAGTSWQSFDLDDEHLALDTALGKNQALRVDTFTNRYLNTVSRQAALPFVLAPGDSPGRSYSQTNVAEFGATVTDTFAGRNNDASIGYTWLNTAYSLLKEGVGGSPIVNEQGVLLRDVYHPRNGPVTAYLDADIKRASATNSSYIDPRLSAVYTVSRNDVVRVAAGATTTQPSGNQLEQPFKSALPGGAGGGAAINCNLNSIGTAPSTVLDPERGVDEEVAYGHRFADDSQIQAQFFTTNVYNKLYSTTVPLSQSGIGFIPPAYLQQALNAVGALCPNALETLGVSGTLNVGTLRSRGFLINGRQRLTRSTFVDYDWTLDSTAIVSAPTTLLKTTRTLILGSQLPRLPLHTFDVSLDQGLTHHADLRYTLHAVSANNTKSLPAYDSSDLAFNAPILNGIFSVSVDNLFDQNAFIEGLRYEGVPLALNAYATAADYGILGQSSTERFGLPDRSVFVNFTLKTR